MRTERIFKILVFEEEPSVRLICQRVLASEGFVVDLASNWDTTAKAIESRSFDLFLIDIRLPTMNGIELYRRVQSRYPNSAPVVVFTTGDIVNEDIRFFIEQTGNPCVPKPFTPPELVDVIRKTASALNH